MTRWLSFLFSRCNFPSNGKKLSGRLVFYDGKGRLENLFDLHVILSGRKNFKFFSENELGVVSIMVKSRVFRAEGPGFEAPSLPFLDAFQSVQPAVFT